jgi:hypothetical protein
MLGSSVVEIAIGVISVYLVLSLMSSAVNEGLATVINKRGRNLFEGIKNLLNDPTFTGLAQQIYSHGLVDGVSQDAGDPSRTNRRPSYLPSKTFSLALLDILGAHGVVAAAHGAALTNAEAADDVYERALAAAGGDQTKAQVIAAKAASDQGQTVLVNAEATAKAAYDAAVQAGGAAPDAAQLQIIAQAKKEYQKSTATLRILAARRAAVASARNPKDAELIQKADNALEEALLIGRNLALELPNQLDNIQAAVNRLPNGHTKESLLVLIEKSKREVSNTTTEIQQFEQNVEVWFNDSMDRVAGWYKRWTQKIQLIVALIIVLLLNADTLMLAKQFSSQKDMRAAVLAQAEKAGKTENLDEVARNIEPWSFPLGWVVTNETNQQDYRRFPWIVDAGEEKPIKTATGQILLKLIGLLISIAAVSLGAPFWFDILSRFINMRGAGTPPGEKKKGAG